MNSAKIARKIKAWGSHLTNSFVRKGSSRLIEIKDSSGAYGKNTPTLPVAHVFIAYTYSGELNIQVRESGDKFWNPIYKNGIKEQE